MDSGTETYLPSDISTTDVQGNSMMRDIVVQDIASKFLSRPNVHSPTQQKLRKVIHSGEYSITKLKMIPYNMNYAYINTGPYLNPNSTAKSFFLCISPLTSSSRSNLIASSIESS